MAHKAKVKLENGEHWFLLPYAAHLLGTTQAKMKARAVAGEFAWQEDRHGLPLWFKAAQITEARSALQKAEAVARTEQAAKPKAKSPRQLEAQWAREAAANQPRILGGMNQLLHLKLTLPTEKKDQ